MKVSKFETEHYYALYEFSAPHLLSVSDCETISIADLLQLADLNLTDLGEQRLGYTESQGNPELRQAIAKSYKNIASEDVLVLATPIEGLFLTMQAILEPQDEAIVLTPAYDALFNLPKDLNQRAKAWPLKAEESKWALDFEALERLISSKTKLLVVNFPHNPTGFLPTKDEFNQLIDLAKKHDLYLLCDEMYRGLEFSDAPQLASAVELYEKSVVLSGLSKSHGLPGLRAGWLVTRDKGLYENLLNWKLYTSICPAAPVEFLAMAALKAESKLIQKNKEIIKHNLKLAEPFFEKWQSLFVFRAPLAGSIALVELKAGNATSYCHGLAKDAGVVLLPSRFMQFPDSFVRFGFGRTSFQIALEHYDAYLDAVSDKA